MSHKRCWLNNGAGKHTDHTYMHLLSISTKLNQEWPETQQHTKTPNNVERNGNLKPTFNDLFLFSQC